MYNYLICTYHLNIEHCIFQMKEARKQLIAMNPHYLKTNEAIDDIPVAPIDLPVPLKIPGKDKYFACTHVFCLFQTQKLKVIRPCFVYIYSYIYDILILRD